MIPKIVVGHGVKSINERSTAGFRFNPLLLQRVDACGLISAGIPIGRSFAAKRSFDDERRVHRKLAAGFTLEPGENGDAPLDEAEGYYLGRQRTNIVEYSRKPNIHVSLKLKFEIA